MALKRRTTRSQQYGCKPTSSRPLRMVDDDLGDELRSRPISAARLPPTAPGQVRRASKSPMDIADNFDHEPGPVR